MFSAVDKIKLNYTFNNPNSVEDTAEQLLKLFIEVNKQKVDEIIKNAVDDGEKTASHPAWVQDGFNKITIYIISWTYERACDIVSLK